MAIVCLSHHEVAEQREVIVTARSCDGPAPHGTSP
jgi:hypothetical protein